MSALNIFKKSKDDSDSSKTKKPVKDEKKVTEKAKKKMARIESGAYRVLVRPIISEKSTLLVENNQYVFEVCNDADKKSVAQAVKDVYGVVPTRVRILNVKGKSRRFGKTIGRTKARKKAIVSLSEGQTIQVYEGV